MKIMLAMTCYRCEKQVVRVLEKLSRSFSVKRLDYIAVIDNRSPDLTMENALKYIFSSGLKEKANVYLNDANYGLGGSHKVAFDLAKSKGMDYIFILHGDDQAEVDDLDKFLTFVDNGDQDAAFLGSRFSFASKLIGYQKNRIFGNIVLNVLFSVLTLKKITDLGSGLNLYSVNALEKIPYHSLSSQFTFNVELMLEMISMKMKLKFIPITWKEEDQQSNAKNFSVASRMFVALIRWRLFKMQEEAPRDYTTTLIRSL